MTSDTAAALLLLGEGFNKPAWHGPSLLGALRGMTLAQLLHRPRRDVHNAWELVLHSAYWKHTARRRLLRGKGSPFPLPGSNFFRREKGLSLADWKKDLALLKQQHSLLLETVRGLEAASYDDRIAGSRHTVRRTIFGVAAHDIYHAGQISLLKRLSP